MAGIKVLERAISDGFEILQQAKKLGADAWRFQDNTLTILDKGLADAVHRAIDNTDQTALKQEADDLSYTEILRIVGKVPDMIRRLLD